MSDETTNGPEASGKEDASSPKTGRSSKKRSEKTDSDHAVTKSDSSKETAEHPTQAEESKVAKKRGNRRRRGKGKSASKEDLESSANGDTTNEDKRKSSEKPRSSKQPRTNVDPDKLARKAWKIFLAEVSEEGVALIPDKDARELSRRCFRLAEIFMEEQSNRK